MGDPLFLKCAVSTHPQVVETDDDEEVEEAEANEEGAGTDGEEEGSQPNDPLPAPEPNPYLPIFGAGVGGGGHNQFDVILLSHPNMTELLIQHCTFNRGLCIVCPNLQHLSLGQTIYRQLSVTYATLTSLDLSGRSGPKGDRMRSLLTHQSRLMDLDLSGRKTLFDGIIKDVSLCALDVHSVYILIWIDAWPVAMT